MKITKGTWPNGAPRNYIECTKCKRTQTIKSALEAGGITPTEAKKLGWTATESGWLCMMGCNASPTKAGACSHHESGPA